MLNKLKRFISVLALSFLLFNIATPLIPKANADALSTPLLNEAKAYTSYWAFMHCATVGLKWQGDSDADIRKGYLFNLGGFSDTVNSFLGTASTAGFFINSEPEKAAMGHHVNSSDGYVLCEDSTFGESALKRMGVTTTDFRNKFYKENPDDASEAIIQAKYLTNGALDIGKIQTEFNKMIDSKTFDPNKLSDAARYVLLMENLTKGCSVKGKPYKLDNKAELDEFKKIELDNRVEIQEIDSKTGNKIKVGYEIDKSLSDEITVGQGVTEDAKYTCKTIGNLLNQDKLIDAYKIKYTEAKKKDKTVSSASAKSSSSTDLSKEIDNQCAVSINPITWIMCALIEGFSSAVDTLDAQITDMLNVRSSEYFGDDNTGQDNNFKSVWNSMRVISVGLLVLMGLVMIISTAIGSGPFDAYTVKKIMPRIIIVVVLINFSWAFVKFAIDLSSDLGFAVRGLIQSPFTQNGEIVTANGGVVSIGAVALIGTGLALGLPGLLSFIVTAFLAVMIAFLTLILRQILIIILAISAPVALVMYILPNTQKMAKLWWDSFSKALLVFPIISGFIAMGRVFAVVSSTEDPDIIHSLISFIAYYAPYFLIPQAFKMAGGALANLSGAVNDRSRGAFDRLKNFRKGQSKKNWEKSLSGNRFNPEGRLNRFNNMTQAGALIGSGKAGLDPRRFGSRVAAQREIGEMEEAEHLIKENEAVKAIFNDDHLMTAASTMRGRENIRRFLATQTGGRFSNLSSDEMEQTISMVENAQKAGSRGSIQIAAAIAHAASGTGGTAVELMQEASEASHGSQYLRNRIIAAQASAAGNARRPDITNLGHTEREAISRGLAEGTLSTEQAHSIMMSRAMETGGVGSFVNAREEPFALMMQNLGQEYINARNGGNLEQASELGAQIAAIRGAMSYAPAENKAHISTMLEAIGVDLTSQLTVDQQLGMQIGSQAAAIAPPHAGMSSAAYGQQLATQASQLIRNRAGAFEQQTAGQSYQQQQQQQYGGGPIPPPPGGNGS